MKLMYSDPEMEVVRFAVADIICTSGADSNYPTSDDSDDLYPDSGNTQPTDSTDSTDATTPTDSTDSTGSNLTDGGAGGDVGSGDSEKWENLFPGLSNP